MTSTQIAILGAIAGFTIFLGLPIGRLGAPSRALREFLNAAATGILVFLLWEVLSHAAEPVEESLVEAVGGEQSWSSFAVRAPIVVLGFGLGLIGLAYYERWMAARAGRRFGPGAMAVGEPTASARPGRVGSSPLPRSRREQSTRAQATNRATTPANNPKIHHLCSP